MKEASATIDLTKLAGDSKELVESMAHELEGSVSEERGADLRWPARFISRRRQKRPDKMGNAIRRGRWQRRASAMGNPLCGGRTEKRSHSGLKRRTA